MIVIVDYGMGNVGSIRNMLKRIGKDSTISADPNVIKSASMLILPGVGAFDNGMRRLHQLSLIPLLNQKVLQEHTPVLGICLGMQLFTARSEEGSLPGLGWIDAETVRFSLPAESQKKIPHMGWNYIEPKCHPEFWKELEQSRYYFVHSYRVQCKNPSDVMATADYGGTFTAAICRGNIFGTQFHPEKSHRFGMTLLRNIVGSIKDVSPTHSTMPAA